VSLEQRLSDDMKEAMRAKDELRLSVIRMIRGQILLEKKKGTGVTDVPDDVVVGLVRGHAKRLKESIEAARTASREDLATQAERELAITQVYLPAELPDAKLEELVKDAVAKSGAGSGDARQVGAVMKVVMEQVKGQADGRRVQEFVKKALGL
jgi:uncharacterized protein YqeY